MCAAASTLWSMPPCEALAPFVGLVPVLWQSRWYWGFAYRDEDRSSGPASACTEVLRELDMKQRLSIVCDLAKGVAHLHAAGVMHGNLAPDNMLVVHTAERPSALALVLYGVDGIRHNISFLSGPQIRSRVASARSLHGPSHHSRRHILHGCGGMVGAFGDDTTSCSRRPHGHLGFAE